MINTYLISSEIGGIVTYYTADSSGILSSIGTSPDFAKGFSDDVLANVSNIAYSGLTNGKLWVDNTITSSASTDTTGDATVISDDNTAIDTQGYSSIISVTPIVTGDVRLGLSFTGNSSFKTRELQYVPAANKLLPTSPAARASIATINNAYDALFDGDNATYYSSNVALNTIPMDFVATHKLRKFVGKLTPNCILPVSVTLQIYDGSSYKDVSTLIVNVTDTEFTQTFNNADTNTKYRFKLQYTDDGSGKVLEVAELNVYDETSKMVWVTCLIEDLRTKGLTVADLATLTSLDYSDIFNNTKLDWAAYIPAGGTFTELIVAFPANTAPSVVNFTASSNSIHAENINLSFKVVDLEKMTTFYSIKVNGVEIVPTTTTPNDTIVNGIIINNAALNIIGSNTITITVSDDFGATANYDFHITKVDNLPTYIGNLLGHKYTFNIADIDGDMIKYRTVLNGKEIEAESALFTVPFSHTTVMDTRDILIDDINTLVITITDSVGGITTITEEFIGEYDGLMFADENGNYLTTDLGDLIKYLDFGVIIAGTNSLAKEVQVINKTQAAISTIGILGPRDINGHHQVDCDVDGNMYGNSHVEGNIYAKLSLDDSFTTPVDTLSLRDLNPDEKTSFFVKIMSMDKSTGGDFTFHILGAGKSN